MDVRMGDMEFEGMEVAITAGSTVRWTNDVTSPHDVTAADGSWSSPGGPGGMAKGDSYSRVFNEPGTFDYYCTIHSSAPGTGMWGRVTVHPAAGAEP